MQNLSLDYNMNMSLLYSKLDKAENWSEYCNTDPGGQFWFWLTLSLFIIFQELNRLRRAALCYSYLGLLDVLANMLDKECHKATAEVARQLQHASGSLRAAPTLDLNKPITPIQD